jgi:hypothetical protein
MLADAYGMHIPSWVSPVITIGVVAFFFWKSKVFLKKTLA